MRAGCGYPPSLLRPRGTVLPQAKAAEWASFMQQVRHEPRPVTLGEMMKDLLAQVRGVLEPEGWTVEGESGGIAGERVFPEQGVRQKIALSSTEVWGDHRFGIGAINPAVLVLHDAFDEAVVDLKHATLKRARFLPASVSMGTTLGEGEECNPCWPPGLTSKEGALIIYR